MVEQEDVLAPGGPAQARSYHWESLTGQPWWLDASLNDVSDPGIPIPCPFCSQENNAPWLSADGSGWVQEGFRASCTSCQFVITKEVSCVHSVTVAGAY